LLLPPPFAFADEPPLDLELPEPDFELPPPFEPLLPPFEPPPLVLAREVAACDFPPPPDFPPRLLLAPPVRDLAPLLAWVLEPDDFDLEPPDDFDFEPPPGVNAALMVFIDGTFALTAFTRSLAAFVV
jgi:hypothetical protein